MAEAGIASSIRAMSAGDSFIRSAPKDSESCARVRAPITGTMLLLLASTQAIANCAGRTPFLGSQPLQRVDHGLVALAVGAGETWQARPQITLSPVGSRSAIRAKEHHRRSRRYQVPQEREYLLLRTAADQRILDLKVADRMHGLGPADGFRAHF